MSADLINKLQKFCLISCLQSSDGLGVTVVHRKLDF